MANASPCLTVSNVSWWQEGLWPWEGKGGENGRRLGHWVSQGVWGLGSSREAGDDAGSANLLIPTLSWSVEPMSDDWGIELGGAAFGPDEGRVVVVSTRIGSGSWLGRTSASVLTEKFLAYFRRL